MQIFLSEEVHDMMDSKDEIRGLLAKHRMLSHGVV